MIGYIYGHRNKSNNKWYIGQTRQKPEHRWGYGKGYNTRRASKFYRAIQKYGWNNFEHIILKTVEKATKEELNEELIKWESYYVEQYNSILKGYNSQAVRVNYYERSRTPIEEARIKKLKAEYHWYTNGKINLLLSKSGQVPEGFFLGETISEERRQHMGEAAKRRKRTSNRSFLKTEEQKKKISQTLKSKNRHWFTNGQDNIICCEKDCPAGWKRGITHTKEWDSNLKVSAMERSKSCPPPSQKGTVWINNGKINKKCKPEDLNSFLQEGWFKGHLSPSPEARLNMSKAQKSKEKHWYTNGKINLSLSKSEQIPQGFFLGRT